MVLLGSHERCLFGTGASAGRPFVFLSAEVDSGWRAQRLSPPAIEKQVGEPVKRIGGSRIRQCMGADNRRRRPWYRNDHGNGELHQTRLRTQLGGINTPGSHAGHSPRAAQKSIWQILDSTTGDAERARGFVSG